MSPKESLMNLMMNDDSHPDPTSEGLPGSDPGGVNPTRAPRGESEAAAPGAGAAPRESDSFLSAVELASGFFESVSGLLVTLDPAVQALSRLTGHSEEKFMGELVGKFALWVMDLPASGRYHHPGPFGLLEHSGEVAAETVRDLEVRWCREGGGSVLSLRIARSGRGWPLRWGCITTAVRSWMRTFMHRTDPIPGILSPSPWPPLKYAGAFPSSRGLPTA